jgi:hypothetical protein
MILLAQIDIGVSFKMNLFKNGIALTAVSLGGLPSKAIKMSV